MSKSIGRGEKTIKKDKTPGPASYSTEAPLKKIDSYHKPINITTMSGFPVNTGNNISATAKFDPKINQSHRFIDELTKK